MGSAMNNAAWVAWGAVACTQLPPLLVCWCACAFGVSVWIYKAARDWRRAG